MYSFRTTKTEVSHRIRLVNSSEIETVVQGSVVWRLDLVSFTRIVQRNKDGTKDYHTKSVLSCRKL